MEQQAAQKSAWSAIAAERPISVLLIAPSMDILGGQAVQAKRLLTQLQQEPELNISFLPINPRLPGPLRKLQEWKYIRTAVNNICYLFTLVAKIPYYQLIHVFSASHYSFLLTTAPAIVAGRLCGKRVILNYRDGRLEEHLRTSRISKYLMRKVHAIVSPSDYLVDVFSKFGFKAQTIPNVLDIDHFRFRKRRQLRPVFLHNRILEPLYNIGCTLRAFAIVQQRYPNASLTIAHDGCLRGELEQLARDLKLRNTVFIGSVPHDRIPALYDSADIYLTSPDFDCMPGSILECYASGLPVIATAAGGIPHIVMHQNTGLLVPCGDHEALAQSAFCLLENEDLVVRLTANARQECVKYSWPKIRDQWLALYRKLTGREQSPALESGSSAITAEHHEQ